MSKATEKRSKTASPYKVMARKNANYCGYVHMYDLTPNKAYKIYMMKHTEHATYGDGELAFIETNVHLKQRVQLPNKCLREFEKDQIQVWYDDISKCKFPYLVNRETMPDKRFKIDILPDVPEMVMYHSEWLDVPAIEDLDFLQLDSSGDTEKAE